MVVPIVSLFWLLFANVIGGLLALLLLFPSLNTALAPFTYGRWVPLHLNFHLYGWTSLPLLGLLINWFNSQKNPNGSFAATPVIVWSIVLFSGGLSWLGGGSSGKLFLEWDGTLKIVFVAMLVFVWAYVALNAISNRQNVSIGKGLLLASLAIVPLSFWFALDSSIYPPINVNSGGPTGSSLLVSTLGIIFVFCLLPHLLNLPSKSGNSRTSLIATLLIVHLVGFSLMEHGNSSNLDREQIIGLSSALAWFPILLWYYRSFCWPRGATPWLSSFAAWGILLGLSGVGIFLPEVLPSFKFTNALVAHAHIAMAGMITSVNMLILITLWPSGLSYRSLISRRTFWTWQLGLTILCYSLVALALLESRNPGYLFRSEQIAMNLNSVRLLGGTLMIIASALWFKGSLESKEET